VWSGLFVEAVNISVNISLLRKTLRRGEPGESKRYRKLATASIAPVTTHHGPPIATRGPRPAANSNAEAQRAYVEGRYFWSRRSEEALKPAIACFRRAVTEDSDFAVAYSGLADCHATLGYLSHLSPADSFPAARGYAEMALERDPSLAEPYTSPGYVKFYFDWDWTGAEAAFRNALARGPDWAAAHQVVQHSAARGR
jgi:hypothetical protein